MGLRERLGKEWLFCDGGTGSILQKLGLKGGELPETWNLTRPDDIRNLNKGYFEAGSNIVNTNTFGANRFKFDNVEEIVRHRRLCHHLHLSAQSGSDNVLRSMNRHYTRDEYIEIVKMLRGFDPLFSITTDIIVGFPGETEDDFEDSLDIVRQAEFGRTHVFRYSPRKGTAGAAMKDAVPEKVKKDRADALESLGEETAQRFIEANLGIAHAVLIEESREGYATGYTGNYIRTYIEDPEGRIKAGKLYRAVLTHTFRDGALAVLNIND